MFLFYTIIHFILYKNIVNIFLSVIVMNNFLLIITILLIIFIITLFINKIKNIYDTKFLKTDVDLNDIEIFINNNIEMLNNLLGYTDSNLSIQDFILLMNKNNNYFLELKNKTEELKKQNTIIKNNYNSVYIDSELLQIKIIAIVNDLKNKNYNYIFPKNSIIAINDKNIPNFFIECNNGIVELNGKTIYGYDVNSTLNNVNNNYFLFLHNNPTAEEYEINNPHCILKFIMKTQ